MICKRYKCGLSCTLARDIAANGSVQVFWWCNSCWNYADPFHQFVAHDEIREKGIAVDSLPVIDRWPDEVNKKCEVEGCEEKGVEFHHWAPRHLFGPDCENWPKNYLCTIHHKLWHDKITPNMIKIGKNGTHATSPAKV